MHIQVAECDSRVNLYALGSNRIHTIKPGRRSSAAPKIAGFAEQHPRKADLSEIVRSGMIAHRKEDDLTEAMDRETDL